MSNFKIDYKPFDSLLKVIIDNRGKTCPISDTEKYIPLIATNCIRNENLYPIYEKVRFLDKKTYISWFRGHPLPNDIIFVTKGTPGRVCWTPSPVSFCIAQDMVAIRPDEMKIYPKYLFAVLRSDTIQQEIEGLHVGSLIPHFKKSNFNELKIPIVEQSLQEFIGNLYFDFSLKIDLLHRQNKTLEAMAETLFRQWFVEEASDEEIVPLSEFADNIRQNAQVDELKNYQHYVGLEHIPRKSITLSSWGTPDSLESNKSIFIKNDILFGKLRSYFHKVVFASINGICSTDILVIRPKKKEWFSFCLFWFFSKDVVEHSDLGSGGTRMPRTNWEIISSYKVPKPEEKKIFEFEKIVRPKIDRIMHNINQIRTLEQLRDTLLPKLMSGEVRVDV